MADTDENLPSAAPEAGVDEDLAKLAPARRGRSPLVALAVIALCGAILAALAGEVRYALSPREPIALGDARDLHLDKGDPPALADDRLASVRGAADYRNALLFEPKGDSYRRAFYRLLGTGGRLWIRAEQTSTRHDLGATITGRLRRFDALPWAAQVRRYYAEQVKTTRLLDLDELKDALGRGAPASSVHDGARESIAGEEGGEVRVVVDFPDELLVSLPRDRFAVAEDAERELLRLGAPVGPVRESKEAFTFPVRFAVRDAYIAKLEEKGFEFQLRREPFVTSLAGLRAGAAPGTLALPAAPSHPALLDAQGDHLKPRPTAERVEIPWAQVDSVQLSSPIRIPPDAWVITEAELPGDFTYAPALAGVLALFAAFNVWLLIRSLRRR